MNLGLAVLMKDGYKSFHEKAYHPEVTEVVSNFTPRNSKHSNIGGGKEVINFGTQFFLKEVLVRMFNEQFFHQSKESVVSEYKRVMQPYLMHKVDTTIFEELHDLGYLPIEVRSLKEGLLVPYQVPVLTIRNTHPKFAWLPNMLETILSTYLWPMMTSSTTAFNYLKETKRAFKVSGTPDDLLLFMCHDFSFRGMFGLEAAAISGAGHLTSFAGTDTIPAGLFMEKYYNADIANELVMGSVDATEHSVTCSWIEEGEVEFLDYLMETASPSGVLSVVADTWDFWSFVTELLPKMKDKIMQRDGKVVVRPDSGDPVEILCGKKYKVVNHYDKGDLTSWKDSVACHMDSKFCNELDAENPHYSDTQYFSSEFGYFEVTYEPELNRHDKTYYYVDNWKDDVEYCNFKEFTPTAEDKGLVEVLWGIFGGTETETGYKRLDSHIGAIYGDSITLERQKEINKRLMDKGFAPEVVLGIGSYSYQYVTRDTHGSAMKATNVIKSGKSLPIFKDPKTDQSKKSAKGLISVSRDSSGKVIATDMQSHEQFYSDKNMLEVVFLDGKIIKETSLQEIRSLVHSQA